MARFDVYPNPSGSGYLLDVQASLLDHLNTRVVVPLLPAAAAPAPAATLNPAFRIAESEVLMLTQFMAAVPTKILRQPVLNLDARRDEIVAAMDLLFQGF
jgi:toxin CcdB